MHRYAKLYTPQTDEAKLDLALEKARNIRTELEDISTRVDAFESEKALYAAFECMDEAVSIISNEADRLRDLRRDAQYREQRDSDWKDGRQAMGAQ